MLEELKVPYELKTFKRGKDMLAPPELKQVHPLGREGDHHRRVGPDRRVSRGSLRQAIDPEAVG